MNRIHFIQIQIWLPRSTTYSRGFQGFQLKSTTVIQTTRIKKKESKFCTAIPKTFSVTEARALTSAFFDFRRVSSKTHRDFPEDPQGGVASSRRRLLFGETRFACRNLSQVAASRRWWSLVVAALRPSAARMWDIECHYFFSELRSE